MHLTAASVALLFLGASPAATRRTPTPAAVARPTAPIELGRSGRFARGASDPLPYTGEPISLNLKDADLRDVLQTFGKISGLNLVIYPEVKGTVTVTLKDVPWDQALELILLSNQYGYVIEGRVMRIGPFARLAG